VKNCLVDWGKGAKTRDSMLGIKVDFLVFQQQQQQEQEKKTWERATRTVPKH
jgi:hypothetical protein